MPPRAIFNLLTRFKNRRTIKQQHPLNERAWSQKCGLVFLDNKTTIYQSNRTYIFWVKFFYLTWKNESLSNFVSSLSYGFDSNISAQLFLSEIRIQANCILPSDFCGTEIENGGNRDVQIFVLTQCGWLSYSKASCELSSWISCGESYYSSSWIIWLT